MAKWYGTIGFAKTVEVKPGIWAEQIVEEKYSGDLLSNFRKLQGSGEVNDNVNIANKISIIANPFAVNNFHAMRYAVYMGAKWKITDVEVLHPRLILTLGGLYNGNAN